MITLFLGNGINLTEEVSIGWDPLLTSIQSEPSKDISAVLGTTLRFEYIDCKSEKKTIEIKRAIAQVLSGKAAEIVNKPKSIHQKIMALPINTILTTNYDYSLELAAVSSFMPSNTSAERFYSFRRFQEAGGKHVYHIHGECLYPSTICLGYEHYAGMLEKMRGSLVRTTHTKENPSLRFHLYDVLKGYSPPSSEWYYRIFTDDICFLGFGFGSSEADIWWLLSYRSQLIKKYEGLLGNHLYVLDATPDKKAQRKEEVAKRRVLEAFGIEIIRLKGRTYRQKYHSALRLLEELSNG